MKINCIIVDDEPASREILEKYISNTPSLVLVKSCKNAIEASEILMQSAIQLIFLDINMPKISGMQFYKSLTNPPYVIFTTAYPEFAVEGFEVDAVDFLLKPFPFERFLKAVNKLISKININIDEKENVEFILLKSDKKLYQVEIGEIYHLEAYGDYVKIFYSDKALIVHDTFQNMLSQLPSNEFIRVHKSHAIAISKLELLEGNMLNLKDKKVPLGQTYRTDFIKLLKSRS